MEKEISYNQAGESTDIETLVEYCKQGAIENAEKNGEPLSAWRDGKHLIESYLDHNTVAGGEVLQEVASQLNDWLRSQIDSPIPLEARRLEIDERTVLVRREQRPSERYFWASPVDGSPVGADRYVRFLNRDEAIAEARRLGYQVVEE